MDWEMRARGLANDLKSLAAVTIVMGAGVAWAADSWWAKAAGIAAVLAAAGALRDVRIKP